MDFKYKEMNNQIFFTNIHYIISKIVGEEVIHSLLPKIIQKVMMINLEGVGLLAVSNSLRNIRNANK